MADFDNKAKNWDGVPGRAERANARRGCHPGAGEALQNDGPRSNTAAAPACSVLPFKGSWARSRWRIAPPGCWKSSRRKLPVAGLSTWHRSGWTLQRILCLRNASTWFNTLMTLHHIPDTAKILASFYSLLQPGGVLCICDLDKEDGSFHSHEDAFDGHNGFDRKELGKELEKSRFQQSPLYYLLYADERRSTLPVIPLRRRKEMTMLVFIHYSSFCIHHFL